MSSIEGKNLEIRLENGTIHQVPEYRAFWFKKQCYIWDDSKEEFARLVGLDKYVLCSELYHGHNNGLSKDEQKLRLLNIININFKIKLVKTQKYFYNKFFSRRIVYGYNEIIVPVQSILVLLLLEVLNPFYIFQIFTLCVWFADGYYYYTAAIILMSLFGISSSILQTRRVSNLYVYIYICFLFILYYHNE